MATKISKSKFQAQALAIFRRVEQTGQPVITDCDHPKKPADRFIVAQARELSAPLLSADEKIHGWSRGAAENYPRRLGYHLIFLQSVNHRKQNGQLARCPYWTYPISA